MTTGSPCVHRYISCDLDPNARPTAEVRLRWCVAHKQPSALCPKRTRP